ncbi:hypothetical protein LTR17_013618 [Elasticomyces elasticus]|nr:hypothetical protein LTR17_013618 [Elasticomyces elasticus]
MSTMLPPADNGKPKKADTRTSEPPKKRARLDDGMHVAIENPCADESTSLEVDIMILDYLAYQTICACIASRKPEDSTALSLSHNLATLETFLPLFKHKHPGYAFDPELRFRVLLLKLVSLYTQRLTRNTSTLPPKALKQLRDANRARAEKWMDATASPNLMFDIPSDAMPTTEDLERNRAEVLHRLNLPAEDEAYEDAHYGTLSSVSLLDLLPLFVQVSAARSAMIEESGLTEQWMHMAAELMLQAALEQYLVYGAKEGDVVREAFAWGLKVQAERMEVDGEAHDEKEKDEVDFMFTDAFYETEVEGWADIKRSYMTELLPSVDEEQAKSSKDTYSIPSSDDGSGRTPSAVDVVSRLEMAAARHPLDNFEASVLGFLDALSKSIPVPVLVQLENGHLNDMTRQETQEFIRNCGFSVAHFYDEIEGLKGATG